MNIYQIKPCKAEEFLPIMKELNSFHQAIQAGALINDVPRLVSLVESYFCGLLYYTAHRRSPYIVEVDKKAYQVKFGGTDEYGNTKELEYFQLHFSILSKIFDYLANNIDAVSFEKLMINMNAVLLNSSIDIDIKASVLNSENNHFKKKWHRLVRQLPHELAVDIIEIRKKFILNGLQESIIEANFPTQDEYNENIESAHRLYEFYSKTYIKMLVANGHFSDIPIYIQQELKYLKKAKKLNQDRLITFSLIQLLVHNNLFQLLDKVSIKEIVESYEEYVEKQHFDFIHDGLTFNPDNFELGEFKLRLYDPNFNDYNVDEDIDTLIHFVIPFLAEPSSTHIELGDGVEVYFETISSLYQDPIFSFLDELEQSINGMPISFFSDSIGNLQNCVLITIKLPYFHHPHFELVNGEIEEKDLSLEAAKRGGRYHPYKDLIVDTLYKAHSLASFPIEIDLKEITSNLISNYMIAYYSKDRIPIHHEIFTITNVDSYLKAKNRYIDELNKLYIEDELIDINRFIRETKITNGRSFLEFSYKFLELTIKKAIELRGLHTALWEENDGAKKPIRETKAQSIITNVIRDLAQSKGIQISRETEAADGSLDFHFSYTNNEGELLQVCVELKNAHHNYLKHGIESQLPLYIKDVGQREGIFLVLWYKNDDFDKPPAYSTIAELDSFLSSCIPNRFKIKPMIIDCTKKISPSKPGSADRLK